MTHASDLFGHAPPALLARLAPSAMVDAEIKVAVVHPGRNVRLRAGASAVPRPRATPGSHVVNLKSS
jgi:hypothetical protein